ncbi:hypothetical protein [Amycolatopsis suaedae]|uniref:Uncharacterized protein n=1 Tax=Amycolatopsis suaedae TaxID=2510978 RepID=A0A4Q7IY06_9PSEU|nr:hypothetical protein [Amycolatopsis suaedae]RZQ59841.1 hypothetical protein EWH70_32525 [Amycolatopsis suaedae]
MAFPDEPLDINVELFYDGVWNDITTHCLSRNDITVSRGRRDEASKADPGKCTLVIDNTDGRYSPRNPMSPLYGKIGRNTPLRVRVGAPDPALSLPGAPEISGCFTPDVTELGITGDIDIRIDIGPRTWRPYLNQVLVSKFWHDSNNRSWILQLRANGQLDFAWSSDGTLTSSGFRNAFSTASIPANSDRLAVRVTLDVDNGSGGRTTTFYTAPTIAGPWTQLGSPVIGASTTSIFDSVAAVEIGAAAGEGVAFAGTEVFHGRVHAFELRNGIDGAVVANPVFTSRVAGEQEFTFTDGAGRVWSVHGDAAITDRSVRFAGEVSSWPSRWDPTGADVWVPVTASGVLRRLGHGASPLRSAMFRGMTNPQQQPPALAYWPCEDGADARQAASAVGGTPMRILGGSLAGPLQMASYSGFVSSAPLPVMRGESLLGYISGGTDTGELRAFSLLHVPDNGVPTQVQLLNVWTTGTTGEWMIEAATDGSLILRVRDQSGIQLFQSGNLGFNVNGRDLLFGLWLRQVGADVEWQVFTFEVGDILGGFALGGTLAGRTFGRALRVAIGWGGNLGETAMGHVAVQDHNTEDIGEVLFRALSGWQFETAGTRVDRLTTEETVPCVIEGDPAATEPMGQQGIATVLDLVGECAAADLGVFGERRDFPALWYRTRHTLYNQRPALELDYAARQVAPPFEPEDDDQATVNDITVRRKGGSSARAVDETGPLSVLPPPDGVGRYDDTADVNVANDAQLTHQAAWRLHLGTVDEARYPQLRINLARSPELIPAVTALDVGDRITVANTPDWLPPDTVDLIAQGYTERLNSHVWSLTFNCTPGSPWNVGVVGDTQLGRADTAGSQIATAVTSGATTVPVTTTEGPQWTTDPAEMPFDIRAGGEVMTVTAVANGASDTFTRTVANGWGTATTGEPWATSGGSASDFSVSGTQGLVSQGTVNVGRLTVLPVNQSDVDFAATVATDKLATGAPQLVGLLARHLDSDNYLFVRPALETNQTVTLYIIKRVAGSETVLTAVVVPGLTHGAGTRFGLRMQVIGTTIRGKIWLASTPEPAAWTLETSDTELTAVGAIGTYHRLVTGTSNAPVVASWDDLVVRNPQLFTVTRAVNGITKSHAAGTDVRLAQPAIIAL